MILLFGPVGAGKSVQGEKLAKRNGWRWLSTGQMFRASEDPEVKRVLAAGELIDDQTTFGVVEEAFGHEKTAERIVLDGFPRTTAQAEWLISDEQALGRKVALVVVLEVPLYVIQERLAGRGRDEDTPDKIARRMQIYHQQTDPILQYFADQNIDVAQIDGTGSIDEIHERIVAALQARGLME